MKAPPRAFAIIAVVIVCGLGWFAFWRKTPEPEPVYQGKPLGYWLHEIQDQGLDSQPSAKARESIKAIRAIGTDAIPFLIKRLQPPYADSTVPSAAAAALIALGPQATSAIPELAKLIDQNKPPHSTKSYGVWYHAVEVLSHLGPEALPVMLKAATNIQGQHVQWQLIQRIGNFETDGAPAIPLLTGWCNDKDPWVRLGAVNALGQIGLEPEIVVPVLLAALKDPNEMVRRDAAEALGVFHAESSIWLKPVIEALDDPGAQTGALTALGNLKQQKEVAVALIIKKLNDNNWVVRRVAAFALGELGGQEAFAALMQQTNDPEGFVREAVFQSLKKIDPEALEKSGKTFATSGKKKH